MVQHEKKLPPQIQCGNLLLTASSGEISLERALEIMMAGADEDDGTDIITLYPQSLPQFSCDQAPSSTTRNMPSGRSAEGKQTSNTSKNVTGPSDKYNEIVETISSDSDLELDSNAASTWIHASESIEVLLRFTLVSGLRT